MILQLQRLFFNILLLSYLPNTVLCLLCHPLFPRPVGCLPFSIAVLKALRVGTAFLISVYVASSTAGNWIWSQAYNLCTLFESPHICSCDLYGQMCDWSESVGWQCTPDMMDQEFREVHSPELLLLENILKTVHSFLYVKLLLDNGQRESAFLYWGGSGKEEKKEEKMKAVYCVLILAEGSLHSESNKQNQPRITDVKTLVCDIRISNMGENCISSNKRDIERGKIELCSATKNWNLRYSSVIFITTIILTTKSEASLVSIRQRWKLHWNKMKKKDTVRLTVIYHCKIC